MKTGIDIGGTKMLMTAFDGEIAIVERVETGFKISLEEIISSIRNFFAEHSIRPSSLGIAIPGLVQGNNKVMVSDVVPALIGADSKMLSFADEPAILLNDVDAALYGEIAEKDKKAKNIIMIMCGTGIGASFFLNGSLFNGTSGWAGELGNMIICRGKKQGTVDLLASGAAMETSLKMKGVDILAGAIEEDRTVMQEISQAGRAMGVAVANLLNLLNPDEVIIGGGLSSLPGYFDSLKTEAETLTISDIFKNCRIQQSNFGKLVVARGAALYAAARS